MMKDRHPSISYLDSAATTPLDPLVWEAMKPFFHHEYGNPSMSYRLGSTSKTAIEKARRTLAEGLHAEEGNLFFTSGGTESNNWAIKGIVAAHHIAHVITSPLEHKSVLAAIGYLVQRGEITAHYVPVDPMGALSFNGLETLLKKYPKALVSLMHGNNELGNLTDLYQVGMLCRKYGALFHTDMVQTIGYEVIDLAALPVDLCTGSAHKFYGPKGIGFLYVKSGVKIAPLLHGGAQETGLRAGTENVPLIVGMGKAFELACTNREVIYTYVEALKTRLLQEVQKAIPRVIFHGECANLAKSLPHIVNLGIPWKKHRDTLLFYLDIENIYASAGSACMSGSTAQSHVLQALGVPESRPVIRFSLCKYNTPEEVHLVAKKIAIHQDR